MSIIVQCGHELTRSEELITILNRKGLSEPLKSSRMHLTPTDVTVALDKIYQKTSRLIDNKLAESVAIDFLLTNLEVENWGWNSNKNLTALHFWEWLEPNCKFVLVFDHPSVIFKHALKNNISQDLLNNIIEEWVIFQKDLLEFFVDNKDKCILLEGDAALKNFQATEECINIIAPELKLNNEAVLSSISITGDKKNSTYMDGASKKEELNNKLSYKLLNRYPELMTVYNSLTEESSIKASKGLVSDDSLDQDNTYFLINELQRVSDQNYESVINDLKVKIKEKESKILSLKKMLNTSEEDNKKQADLVKKLNKIAESNSHSLENKKYNNETVKNNSSELADLRKENKIILRQLHIVQKELEYYFNLEETENTQELKKFESAKTVDKVSVCNDSKHTPELQSQSIKKTKDVLITEAPKVTPFGAEKRIKMELPYRIGASIIENSRTKKGILTMPKAIAMEYIDYNKNMNLINSLPSIEEYGDFDKAEKIKQHLSYQIGEIVAESIKEPKKIIAAPIKIGNRVLFFKKSKLIKSKK